MRIEAADYIEAAQESLSNAKLLYEAAQYAFALHAAGVAVESLLRAFIAQIDPILEARHNQLLLLRASNLRNLIAPSANELVYTSLITLANVWSNDLRYISNNRLRRRLKKLKLDRGIRGDFLKENCRIATEMAAAVLKIGEEKWKRS